MAGQGRKKMTEEEKLARAEERKAEEEQKRIDIQLFKDGDYINQLDDEIIYGFLKLLKTKYNGMSEETAVKMLFEGFVSEGFEFESETTYSVPKKKW